VTSDTSADISKRAGAPLKGREAKLQQIGAQIVGTLYMIVRNIRMYDPENEIFAQPIEMLRDLVNTTVAMDRRFELAAAGTLLSLNGYLLRFEFSALENVRFLTNAFKDADIGGFTVDRPVQPSDLKQFLRSINDPFAEENVNPQVADHVVVKKTKFKNIVAKLKQQNEQVITEHQKLDKRKYALTVYARGVYFMKAFLEKVVKGDTLPDITPATRIIRDLVDICRDSRDHFLGMTTTRKSDEYLAYHLMNTALLAVVMGAELGFTREQLLDLGKAALFHDIGLAGIDPGLLQKKGVLSPEERAALKQNPLLAVKFMLRSRPLDLSMLKCILAAHEAKLSYNVGVPREDGELDHQARPNHGVFGRIIHVASSFDALTSNRPFRKALEPEEAFAVMSGKMMNEFDPVLLQVFACIVAQHTEKKLGKKGVSIDIA
jgi:HD-GYP domain-containing protein (c-di-GMP phosphodiesterase class II)